MLRESLATLAEDGEDPETLWKLGERYGYEVRVGWIPESEQGAFYVEYLDPAKAVATRLPRGLHEFPDESIGSIRARQQTYGNDPLGRILKRQLVSKLRHYLEAALPTYMIPGALVVLDSFPLTPHGKLDRHALPAPDIGSQQSRPDEAPCGELEENLAGIWEELLRLDRVGRNDNFFELGGHSLMAMKVLSQVRVVFGVDLPMTCLFRAPTLREFAGHVASAAPSERPATSRGSICPGDFEYGSL
jgi:hypothetical protein